MKLIRFGPKNGEKPGLLLSDGKMLDVSALLADYDGDFFASEGILMLKNALEHKPDKLPEIDNSVRLGPPVVVPGKILCIGLNYRDHAEELGLPIPTEPVLFFKSPTALAGPHDNLVLPKGSTHTDWEVELSVVIGKKAVYVSPDEAMSHIAGFLLFNDYSERNYQFDRGGQWCKGKSADTFATVGPFVTTPDEIKDSANLSMWLKVNGHPKQNGNTKNMIFKVSEIISTLSSYMTLMPGDIISTGTPPGVGYRKTPSEYLRNGDVIEFGAEGLGEVRQMAVQYDEA